MAKEDFTFENKKKETTQASTDITVTPPLPAALTIPASKAEDLSGKSDVEVLDAVLNKSDDELMPWEPITLPSKGVYYEGKIPHGVVEIRPMSIYTEKILSTPRLAKSGQAFDMLFKNCVRFPDPNFDPINLLAGDGTFLLFCIRGITYGNDYEFTIECSNEDCRSQMMKEFDLNKLQGSIQYASKEHDTEPFEITLPYMSSKVGRDFKVKVRMIRRYDYNSMVNTKRVADQFKEVQPKRKGTRQARGVQPLNDIIERNLNTVIVEAMGTTDKGKIKQLVEKLHSSDTATIREFLDEVSPGIDTSIVVECPDCGTVINTQVPITESFFRPKKHRGDREQLEVPTRSDNAT
jgi:predicted Fe-Mo cluster-binding NifX family protein